MYRPENPAPTTATSTSAGKAPLPAIAIKGPPAALSASRRTLPRLHYRPPGVSRLDLQQPACREIQDVGVAAGAMIGGHEVVADDERERQHAAGLGLLLAGGNRAEEQAQVVHAAVVNAAEALGDRRVTPGPVTDGQVDRQEIRGERERASQPYLRPGVAAMVLDAVEHLIGAHPLPGVEHLL